MGKLTGRGNLAHEIIQAVCVSKNAGRIVDNAKLLRELEGVPEAQRSARFQCVLVYMKHPLDPTPLVCQGAWEGIILDSSRGVNGFGYDPLFYVPEHRCSSAELPAADKNALSHRGQALRDLARKLHDLE